MINSIVLELRWTPDYIETLYIDAKDRHGIEYWYNVIMEANKKTEDELKKIR